jgi:4-carboxymuconolactone decarboxylase
MKLTNQDAIAAMDHDFAQMAIKVGQHAWGLPQLTTREKAIVFLAADLCARSLGFALQTHVKMAREQGVSTAALREAVRHLAPYVGYPTAAEALMALTQIEAPLPEQTEGNPSSPAELDSSINASIRQLDEEFGEFFTDQYLERWGRSELSTRERALATIATDVLQGTLNESLRLHVKLALSSGAGEEQIRAVVLQVAEFGIAKAWDAYQVLPEVFAAQTH